MTETLAGGASDCYSLLVVVCVQRRRYCGQFLESEPHSTGDTAVKHQNSDSPAVPSRTRSVSDNSSSRSSSVSSAAAPAASTSGVPHALASPPADMMKLNLSVLVWSALLALPTLCSVGFQWGGVEF